MSIPNIEEIKTLFINATDKELNTDKINNYIDYYQLIWKLREIGEYQAAVDYLANRTLIMGQDAENFTKFCDQEFFETQPEEQKIANDIVNIVNELVDERHFVFSKMKSEIGQKLINNINEKYAYPRDLRYNAIFKVISEYKNANIVDIGCAESRLEEHCNRLNKNGNYNFHVADRSTYILTQGKYRNRMSNNIRYYNIDFSKEYSDEFFKFDKKAPQIVVISEFIEHMQKEDSKKLLKRVLQFVRPVELIITTPNYNYSEIYKKDDPNNIVHIFEFREDEFIAEMNELLKDIHEYKVSEYKGIAGLKDLPQSLFIRISLS